MDIKLQVYEVHYNLHGLLVWKGEIYEFPLYQRPPP